MMGTRKHYIVLIVAGLMLGGCKTDDSSVKAESETIETETDESQSGDEKAAEPEKASADKEPEEASNGEHSYEVREYERTPWAEEYLDVKVFWDADKAMLSPCEAPVKSAPCKRFGPTVEKGDELTWTKSLIRVTPRVMTAQSEIDVSLDEEVLTLKPGDELAFYVYQGEGTCAVAVGDAYAEGVSCPESDEFDNFPEGNGSTAQVLQPAEVEWWIEIEDGWVVVNMDRVRVEFESMEP